MTVTDIIMLDTAVFAPALWFTADRENAPESKKNFAVNACKILQDYKKKGVVGRGYGNCTCSDIAGSGGANNVHHSNGYHLLVPINSIVLQSCKCPSHGNSFLFPCIVQLK